MSHTQPQPGVGDPARPSLQGTPVTAPSGRQPQDQLLLGRYRIMGSCGTGGFGTVLTCWDTRLQRRVAIKRMPLATVAGSQGLQQVPADNVSTLEEALGEARTASMLEHPGIVAVHDFEVENACAYLVMEYVDGLTLSQLLERVEGGTLTPDEVAYLVEQVAKALAFAHENGVLHLDIKPSNIMFDRQGQVKLCDFGMATLASAAGYGGARGGTVGYMPPEQILGDLVDERTDVFSLAVVTWQALTGSDPFAAPTAEESLKKIERGPRQHLSKLVPESAGMAEEAIMGALDPSPSRRLASVEDFAHEVSFGLGDQDAGRASIRQLMGQTDDEADEPDVWDGERLTFAEKHPRARGRMIRLASAVLTGWGASRLAVQAVPAVFAASSGAQAAYVAICATLAFLWPQSGSLLVAGSLALAFAAASADVAAVLLPGIMLIVLAVWWVRAGRHADLSTTALLCPWCLSAPAAGVAISGASQPPRTAAVTTALGWLLAQLGLRLPETGFSADPAAELLGRTVFSPAGAISLAGAAVAAAVCAALYGRSSENAGRIGAQVVGAAILALSQAFSLRVENGGIWQPPTWATVGVAVVLCVIVSFATVLSGPRSRDQEDDD